jgi:hypothetical protein
VQQLLGESVEDLGWIPSIRVGGRGLRQAS